MGKIYEATLRQEQEQQQTTPAQPSAGRAFAFEEPAPPRNAKPLPESKRSRETPATEPFDFLDYSLDLHARDDFTAPRRRHTNGLAAVLEAEAPAPMPAAPVMPLREVELELGRLDPHLIMLNECDPTAAEQYHRLAASLIAAAVERPLKRVLITSALHGDGRTCVTLNLAGALARAKRKVLVVDADLLRPSVLRLLGVESEAGVEEAFASGADEATARAALVTLQPYGFTVLPSRGQVENAAELLASAEFSELLDELDPDYDFVLFDSAPLLATGDAHLLLHYADTALLVVQPDKCRGGQIAQAIAPMAPEDIFGVVINRVTN
jgi:Mrp family chromosome partitioning ATPase